MSGREWGSGEEVMALGTPFEPLADNEVVAKRPELDLTVRDSEGRRRFHGAFTGGFSAGHYMTVGSEEGFTPSQYKSNRAERWDQSLLKDKPENYMDSEDLDVFGIAPKRITARDQFAQQESFAGFRSTDTLIDVLKSVIKPSVESIGLQLYKRMKRNAKIELRDGNRKTYGCEQPSNTSANNDITYKPKSDFHGIGFKSMLEESDGNHAKDMTGVSVTFKSGQKLKISGEAFGYGVLDDDDDIQEDAVVYHKEDISQYDYEIGAVRHEPKMKNKGKHKSLDVLKSDVIDGFVKCSIKINLIEIMSKKYPIPSLPTHWKHTSGHQKAKKSRWDQSSDKQKSVNTSSVSDEQTVTPTPARTPVLNANIRALLLGEEVIHRQGVKRMDPMPEESDSINSRQVDSVQNTAPLTAIKREPIVFQPLTGFWANKFTRSNDTVEETLSGGLTDFNETKRQKTVDNETNEKSSATVRTTFEWHPHNLLCKRFNIPNPFPQYPDVVGVITVGKSDVRNRTAKINDRKTKTNIFDCLMDDTIVSKQSDNLDEENTSESKNVKNSINTNENNDKEAETEEKVRPPMDLFKAIFASDEESDDEDIADTNESNVTNEQNVDKNSEKPAEVINSSQMNSIKTSGIFADIDFDQLNRNFNPILKPNETQELEKNKSVVKNAEKSVEKSNVKSIESDVNDVYGPALPPDSSLLISDNIHSVLNTNHLTEKSIKRKKSDKKHKKHKKHKSNHKHKRHRKASTSSTSSSEMDTKLLKYLKSSKK